MSCIREQERTILRCREVQNITSKFNGIDYGSLSFKIIFRIFNLYQLKFDL